MSDDSFIIPQFMPFEQSNVENVFVEFYDTPSFVKQKRADRKLTYNHYVDCSKKVDIDPEFSSFMNFSGGDRHQTLD